MSLKLELPPELEEVLIADATERGVPVGELANHAVRVFVSYSSPVEKFIQQVGRPNRTPIESPTGERKTAALLELVAAWHGADKKNEEFQYQMQMGILHAAAALWEASNEPLTPTMLQRLEQAFAENEAESALRKEGEEKAARHAALSRLKGRSKGAGPTVDDFLAERSAEGRKDAGL